MINPTVQLKNGNIVFEMVALRQNVYRFGRTACGLNRKEIVTREAIRYGNRQNRATVGK